MCSTAVVAAGGALVATPAFAAGSALTLYPTTTTVNTLNFGALADATAGGSWNLASALGGSTYSIRVATTTTSPLYALLTSAPTTAANLRMVSLANTAGTVPVVGDAWQALTTATPGTTDKSTAITAGYRSFFTADVPGAYVVKFFEDSDASGGLTDDDNVSPAVTINVLDVQANTVATTDDWAPTVSATGSVTKGLPMSSTVDLSGLTLVDARGATSGAGAVGSALDDLLGVAISGANTVAVGAATYGTTSAVRTTTPAAAGSTTSTFTLDAAGNGFGAGDVALGTAVTNVTDNLVTGVTADATDVVGWVKETAGAVALKTGADKAAYTATVTVSSGDKSGKTVYFTLTTGTNTPVLSADGTFVSSTATTKTYSAVTDADGVATLRVTSGTTTAGTTYTVDTATNGQSGVQMAATYADAIGKTFELTTPTVGLFPTTGTAAVLSGKLLDQFGAIFQPAPSGVQNVTLAVDIADADGTWDAAGFTANPTLSSGMFTYSYTPATAPTVGQRDVFRLSYSGATNLDTQLKWTSADAAASVTITAPVSGATPTQKMATVTHGAGTAVTGSVLSAANAGMAYKSVTLTGTPGVYFSDTATPTTATTDDLATSFTVAADSGGAYTAYAFFTKAGAATVTATSGTVNKTVDVVVTEADDPYQVIAIDSAVEPGATSIVTGEVKNGWGFPVAGTLVDLSLGSSKIATLGSSLVTTNGDGVWSTTLTGLSGADGEATLTATLCNAGAAPCVLKTANPTAFATWLANGGVTIAHGEFQDTAKITVDPDINKTVVSAPASRAGAGAVKLTGKAKPGSAVEIFAKPAGTSIAYALVGVATADSDGDWTSTEYITSTTVFYAKTTTSSSAPITVKVTAPAVPPTPKFKVGAKPLGGGKVAITAVGNGDYRSVVTIYQVVGKKTVKVASVKVDNKGVARVTIKTSKGKKVYKVVYINGYKNGSTTVKVTVK